MGKGDKIKGGYADGMSVEDIAKKHGVKSSKIASELKKGIEIEMEHVNSKKLAKEIAMDHLFEIPDYYTRLEKMEKEAKKDMKEKNVKTESKETITEFAKRMRELAGLSEGNHAKSIKTIQEGEECVQENEECLPGENDGESEQKSEEEFETHKFEQKAIEEGADDDALYNLNENTIIVLDFIDEEEK
ncbi:MAG: DUF5661 family protein [Nanoarchaeota archaeon]